MFNKLVASDGRTKKKTATAGTLVTSVVLHGLLVAGAVAASVVVPEAMEKEQELVEYVDIIEEEPAPEPEPEPEPEEPPPPTPQPEVAPPVVKGTQALVPPAEPPKDIPDVDLSAPAVKQEDFSGQGKIGGVAAGVDKGVAQSTAKREEPANEGVYEVSAVSELPKLTNGSEVARTLSRNYPPLLRDAGVTGSATLKFVIDASGRVENASITVLDSTHPQFGDAAKKVVEKMKFKPAKVNGQGVRVQVTQPITFNVES